MKITVQNYGYTVSVGSEYEDLGCNNTLDQMIEVARMVYSDSLVDKYFKND